MKYDRLYNFISPVTGKIADYLQFPILPEDYIIIGDQNNEAKISPTLIDIRLNMMDMRRDIDALQKNKTPDISDSTFILQTPNIKLPNAQALNSLDNGVLGNNSGVIEILQRVSGPTSSTDNNIARFDGITGQIIKDSKVRIDDDGEVYANSLHVTNSIGKNTGFNASTLMLSDVLYSLPTTAGLPTQMLTTPGIPESTGSYQLYWSTPPSQITTDNPYDPNNPYPVFTPIPIPIPITTPFPVPVFVPTPGLPLGTVTASPVSIDPVKGDIDTSGDINANDINGNNADFDGDVDIDGDLSTEGSINSAGDISADGSVSGDAFDFEDISEASNDFVRMEAPFDLDHSYKIELPDAEPIMQEQIQPPDQRILQTAWRRIKPSQAKAKSLNATNTNDNLSITKLSWTELEVSSPITINFIPATSTTNEKIIIGYDRGKNIDIPYAVDLIYGTLSNINGKFNGFNSHSKNHSIKIQTSFDHRINGSSSSIDLINRYSNGFYLKNETKINGKCVFKIQSISNLNTDIFKYDQEIDTFEFSKPIFIQSPILPYHPATKEYVDNSSSLGVKKIIAGTGLSGGIITTNGTIAIDNTTVTAGNYRLGNFNVNAQGQLTSASSSSPSVTTINAVSVWGNTTGTSLLNTNVFIDTSGNISNNNGTSTFLNQQINDADGLGSLKFKSGNYSLQLKLNGFLTNNRFWFLPTTNSNGFFKNNGSGTISWSPLSSSDISNFGSAVRQEFGKFYFYENTLRCDDNNAPMLLLSNKSETVLDDTVFIGDHGLIINQNFISASDNKNVIIHPTNNAMTEIRGILLLVNNNLTTKDCGIRFLRQPDNPTVQVGGYLYVNNLDELRFVNEKGNYYIAG